jgi:hypothetical protein
MKRATVAAWALAALTAGICHAQTPTPSFQSVISQINTPCSQEMKIAQSAMAARIAGQAQPAAQTAAVGLVHSQMIGDTFDAYIGDALANSIVAQAYSVAIPQGTDPDKEFGMTVLYACIVRGGSRNRENQNVKPA